MFVKIYHNETYLGTRYKAGAVIEVDDDLGHRMISAGKVTKATKPVDEVTAESIDAMSYKDMKKLVSELGIETSEFPAGKFNTKMPTYSAALKAHYGV